VRIAIAERLRPFTHVPGTSFVLPGSSFNVEIFPACIRFNDAEIALDIEGPVDGFTALQDLENGTIRVFGESQKGYFRYALEAIHEGKEIAISVEKPPANGIVFAGADKTEPKIIFSDKAKSHSYASLERLSLGSHKKQDWELIMRRLSFTEIFPIWHRLGQMVPELSSNDRLFANCKEAIAANAPEKILSEFKKVFLAGFTGVLTPRLIDTDHHGINIPKIDFDQTLLTEGKKLIRSLFVQEREKGIHILPALPPEFHCGRLVDAHCGKQGMLSLEWTKKSIRLMTFHALENQTITFWFADHERKCRLRSSNKDRGVDYIPGSPIEIAAGQDYWFDNFER
jgi:hypothetical protein